MGLIRDTNNVTYLTVVNGKLAQRVKVPTQTSIERTLSDNKVVHEEIFKAIAGKLVKLDTKTHPEYGDSILIYIDAEGERFCVQCPFDSQYGTTFLRTLPHVDLSKPMELSAGDKEEDGKRRQNIFIKQEGKWLKRAFNKDDKHGMPEPIVRKRKGKKDEWDWSEVVEFLVKEVYEPIKKELDEKDDLPF